jgi:DNA end-binding protein Ku
MARQLIESLTDEFDPGKYKDEYREKVLQLIERKAEGEEIAVQPEAPEPAKVPDLMAALEASLAAVRSDDDDGDKPKRKSPSKGGSRAKAKEKEKA